VCFKDIAQTFESTTCETPPPNESITCCALQVFSLMGGIANPMHMSKEYGVLV